MPKTNAAAVPTPGNILLAREELDRILSAHAAFLSNSHKGARAAVLSRDLSGADLSNRILCQADLSGSCLSGANLKFANLLRANLYCCEMRNVDARYANFCFADMRGVTLNGSNLSHARLDNADFRAGRLLKSNGNGKEAVIDRNGSAAGVDFSYCSLHGATFEGADLKGADFTGAIIVATRFKGARMGGAVFKGAILQDLDLADIPLPCSAFADCVLPPSKEAMDARPHLMFRLNAHQRWVESGARLGSCAVFDGEDLRPLASAIGKFKLTAISARRVIAAGCDFSCTELQGANFEGADLRGATFEGSDLRGVKLKGALLHHAKFHGADMRPLQLKTGEMLPCDLEGAEFTAEQRTEAIFE
jgi:uncharacterized protein YjbI with pentapeptide repeats